MRYRSVDTTIVVAQFRTLNRDIYLLCDKTARHINSLPDKPIHGGCDRAIGPYGLQRPQKSFSSVEDYYFFTLLSVVNGRLCEFIFSPPHPSSRASLGEAHASEGLVIKDFQLRECHVISRPPVLPFHSELPWKAQRATAVQRITQSEEALPQIGWGPTETRLPREYHVIS